MSDADEVARPQPPVSGVGELMGALSSNIEEAK